MGHLPPRSSRNMAASSRGRLIALVLVLLMGGLMLVRLGPWWPGLRWTGLPIRGQGSVRVEYRVLGHRVQETVTGVQQVEVFLVRGVPQQWAIRAAGRYLVYNAPRVFSCRLSYDLWSRVEARNDQTFQHYDPYLQGEKEELSRRAIAQEFRVLTGRDPTTGELQEALDDITRGVPVQEYLRRLRLALRGQDGGSR
ncbi:MAG TPA: hypothetical protein GX513_05270 [Firmicutes bacterium]|nr:hypothetical protein [Bacillota bacterium]